MNELQLFNFQELPVRTIEVDGEIYFIGKDIAEILGYSRPAKAIQDHIDKEDRRAVPIRDSIGRLQNTVIINESGLYSLAIDASRQSNNREIKEKAEKFKRFITSKVLPSLRQTGSYQMNPGPTSTIQQIQLLAQGTIELDQRVTAIEDNLLIRPGEAKHIKDLVAAAVRDTRKKYFIDYKEQWKELNKYLFATIWSNFKRHYEIPSYQNLPLKKYEEAVRYLEMWQPGTDIIENVKKKMSNNELEAS